MTVSAPRGPASTPSRCSYPPPGYGFNVNAYVLAGGMRAPIVDGDTLKDLGLVARNGCFHGPFCTCFPEDTRPLEPGPESQDHSCPDPLRQPPPDPKLYLSETDFPL